MSPRYNKSDNRGRGDNAERVYEAKIGSRMTNWTKKAFEKRQSVDPRTISTRY